MVLDRLRGKKKDISDLPLKQKAVKEFNVELKNQVHVVMAGVLSDIARLYIKDYNLVKYILVEYSSLIECALFYRETGNPEQLFLKLQEFILRSLKPNLGQNEAGKVNQLVDEALFTIEQYVVDYEAKKLELLRQSQFHEQQAESNDSDAGGDVWKEKWSSTVPALVTNPDIAPVESKVAEESLKDDDPITKVKGIGKKKADTLRREYGIETVGDYKRWKAIQARAAAAAAATGDDEDDEETGDSSGFSDFDDEFDEDDES